MKPQLSNLLDGGVETLPGIRLVDGDLTIDVAIGGQCVHIIGGVVSSITRIEGDAPRVRILDGLANGICDDIFAPIVELDGRLVTAFGLPEAVDLTEYDVGGPTFVRAFGTRTLCDCAYEIWIPLHAPGNSLVPTQVDPIEHVALSLSAEWGTLFGLLSGALGLAEFMYIGGRFFGEIAALSMLMGLVDRAPMPHSERQQRYIATVATEALVRTLTTIAI